MGERLLVIDSATEACSVALFERGRMLFDGDTTQYDDAKAVAGDYAELGRGHAERLVPMIAALPDRGHADRIMVNLGPGSFTGIRVGIAAARALGLAWGVPVGGYGCLDLVAAQARQAMGANPIDVVMAGGHGEWFFQPFAANGTAIAPFVSLSPDGVLACATARIVAGSQAAAVSAQNGAHACVLRPDARAFGLLDPALWRADTRPVYGRAPDARLPQTAQIETAPIAAQPA